MGEYNELYHHGVKGQKWGVRRYQSYAQNPKKASSGAKNLKAAKQIFESLDAKEKANLSTNGEFSNSKYLVNRKILYSPNGKPQAFAEIERDPESLQDGYISVAVHKDFRGQGLSKSAALDVLRDAQNRGLRDIYWETTKDNPASGATARSLGFIKAKDYSKNDDNYVYHLQDRNKILSQTRAISAEARRREPVLTRNVSSCVSKSGAEMYGLEHRLKTPSSIAEKIMRGKEINDAVRYTAILSDKNFVQQYNLTKTEMTKMGYEETRCKNYFEEYKQGKVNHKSVQTNYRTQDGYTFEIQFQTKASQNAKDKKVPLYNEARDPNTSDARKKELEKEMRKLADKVPDPPGIDKIDSH